MDRVMKDVVAPPMWPLGKDKLWDKKGTKDRHDQRNGKRRTRGAQNDAQRSQQRPHPVPLSELMGVRLRACPPRARIVSFFAVSVPLLM